MLGFRLWDTYLAEGGSMKEFLVYVAASFLLHWQSTLLHADFQVGLVAPSVAAACSPCGLLYAVCSACGPHVSSLGCLCSRPLIFAQHWTRP